MKRLKAVFLLLIVMAGTLLSTGCFGNKSAYITDTKKYGDWNRFFDVADFMPESIEEYNVNKYVYSYKLYYYMPSYEVFLDITVTPEQFDEIISTAKQTYSLTEQEAYYAPDYAELIEEDDFVIYKDDGVELVISDIHKIIYNESTLNIVFVSLSIINLDKSKLGKIEYFKRFSIDRYEYAEHQNHIYTKEDFSSFSD